jgi:hypothetical protein
MASSISLPSSLPERLRAALELRNKDHVCPSDVEAVMSRITYFQSKKAAPSMRFAHLASSHPQDGFRREDAWRDSGRGSGGRDSGRSSGGGYGHHNSYNNHGTHGRGGRSEGGDGFEVWHSRRRGQQRPPYVPGAPAGYVRRAEAEAPAACAGAGAVAGAVAVPVSETSAPKFSSAGVKAMDVEDRMLARVKGKINKIGHSTYDATKVFMEQILSSDDTEFLDELMKYVFQKAATESSFCPLYARLIHELADEFTHFRTVMINLFRDYTAIFSEVTTAPDPGTESYKAFVEAQERKKFRRGYSQFVAELVKMGEVDKIAFANLIQQIVTVLETIHSDATNTLLCEEYIDCLANMCKSASGILREASWSSDVKDRLAALLAKPKASVTGFTNKGRFALMDLVDAANRGWVYR